METKYKALRISLWIYQIFGVLALIGGIVIAIQSKILIYAVIGLAIALSISMFVGLFRILMDIEDNTARSAHMLARMNKRRD